MKLRITSAVLLALALAVCAPAGASTIYSNGPINGTVNAWNTSSFTVTDSFVASSAATVSGFDGGFWLQPGDTPISVSWSIGTTAFGSDIASGTSNYSNSLYCSGCGFGFYDIYTSTVSGLSVPIAAGNYWLTLGNAVTAQAGSMYWDENDGPSTAFQTSTGSIGSEAFNVYGGSGTTPEPGTLMLLGSGVIGLAGAIRRKLSL